MAEYKKLRKTLAALKDTKSVADMALCVTEAGPTAPETFVLLRGNPHVPGDKVEPGFPAGPRPAPSRRCPTPPPAARRPAGGTVLADWIASPDNPLTARVMVNRVWQHHFGRGIVRSPNNFGIQGARPTHPELLDWLAAEFVDGGWRLKPLHRLILTSNAYRMSSEAQPDGLAKDPGNDLFWRFDMRRLTAEEIRDSILAVSGNLNLKMYGPGVYPEIPAEVLAGQSVPGSGWGKSSPAGAGGAAASTSTSSGRLLSDPGELRRRRDRPLDAGALRHDAADAGAGHAQRRVPRTSRPAARRAAAPRGGRRRPPRRCGSALRLATARPPSDAEVERGVEFIDKAAGRDGAELRTMAAGLRSAWWC